MIELSLRHVRAVIYLGAGLFLIIGGLNGYTFATWSSAAPPPVMWLGSPAWRPVAVGVAVIAYGYYLLRWGKGSW